MPDVDGRAVIEVLTRHEVRFVLIGGFGAFVHGSPLLVNDVEVVPDPDPTNLSRLSGALYELDAKVLQAGMTEALAGHHDAASLAARPLWKLATKHGELNITFTPSGTTGFDDIARDAEAIVLRGTEVRLASLADIVRTKEATGRDEDRRVLPVLRELLARQKPGR